MKRRIFKPKTAIRLLLIFFPLILPIMAIAATWQWMESQRVYALMKEGSGLWIVDVRSSAQFAEGHIEGAVNIPAGVIATKRLPKGKIVVVADGSLGLRRGREAAEVLLKNGNERVFLLEGGMLAWHGEGYPLAGKPGRPTFLSVMPDDIGWALKNHIPIRIFDLRDKTEQEQGPVPQALAVDGKNLPERLVKAKEPLTGAAKKGLATKLEKPVTTILVFPAASVPLPALEQSFRGVPGDIRYMEGGYAAWAAKPDRKSVIGQGKCPTCPGGVSGGKR